VPARPAPGGGTAPVTVDDAFAALTRRHVDSAYRLAWAILQDDGDADDATQDAFALASQQKASAAQKAGKFKDEIVPVTIKGRKGEDAQAAVDEAVERVRETGEQIKEQARETGEQLMERARTTGHELKEQAQVRLAQARSRAQVMAHQEPFRVIAMSAASGFVMGIVLRLWRDHAS